MIDYEVKFAVVVYSRTDLILGVIPEELHEKSEM